MLRFLVLVVLIGLTYGLHIPILDGRIVGGKDAKIEDHPYQLSLEYFGAHDCGASLIRPNVAITAAHCTERRSVKYLRVRAGSSLVHKGGQVADVLRISDHPKYNGSNYDYDVSVLLLNQSLSLNAGVQTIPLQPVNLEIPTGTAATVTGWGRLTHQGSLPEKLQAVQVPRVDDSECGNFYFDYTVTNRMFCFGFTKGEKDSCQGDSGGPLVVDGRLIGVVSWGYGCAFPNRPGVYTKVSYPEIRSHIEECLAEFEQLQ